MTVAVDDLSRIRCACSSSNIGLSSLNTIIAMRYMGGWMDEQMDFGEKEGNHIYLSIHTDIVRLTFPVDVLSNHTSPVGTVIDKVSVPRFMVVTEEVVNIPANI